jgi:hypothetical protein
VIREMSKEGAKALSQIIAFKQLNFGFFKIFLTFARKERHYFVAKNNN